MTEDEAFESLRDSFAAMAMQGYLSCPEWREDTNFQQTADAAYQMADAMLAARANRFN